MNANLFNSWTYETNDDNSARFIIGENGTDPLVCIGVNPSTATPEKLDNTLRRVKKFSQTLGYDGWLMLNLYPLRATDPNELPKIKSNSLCVENMTCVMENFKNINFAIWAAWGALIEKRPYLSKDCLEFFVNYFEQDRWLTLGDLTQARHPRHPLYLPGNAEVRDFNAKEYLEGFKTK